MCSRLARVLPLFPTGDEPANVFRALAFHESRPLVERFSRALRTLLQLLQRDLTHRRIRMRSRPFVPGGVPSLLALTLLGMALMVPAGAAEAQSHRSAVTLMGGMSTHGDLTPFDTETVFETGWIAGLQAERWLGGKRLGLRLNSLFTQRQLESKPGDYNVYAVDLDLMARLLSPRPGRSVMPYLALGAGATRYAAVSGSPTLAGGAYGGNPVDRAHVLAGFGVDLLAGRRLGLRLEAADKLVLLTVGESPDASGLPTTHNLVFTAGLQLRMGAPRVQEAAERPVTVVTVDDDRTDADRPALYTVQLFSFVEAATASRWVSLLRERGVPVWQLESVIQGERVSRVRVGALPSEVEARALASALERDYGWAVWVDRVASDEAVPANAVDRTRSFLDRR